MAKDVIVVVQRDALPSERESLDILLVSTTGKQPVKVYRDIASVEAVFGPNGTTPNAKIVRKAKTLLNQGKTTLADTLVSKFKIVGFEPTSATPATAASLVLTFTNGNLPEPIEGNHTVPILILTLIILRGTHSTVRFTAPRRKRPVRLSLCRGLTICTIPGST